MIWADQLFPTKPPMTAEEFVRRMSLLTLKAIAKAEYELIITGQTTLFDTKFELQPTPWEYSRSIWDEIKADDVD